MPYGYPETFKAGSESHGRIVVQDRILLLRALSGGEFQGMALHKAATRRLARVLQGTGALKLRPEPTRNLKGAERIGAPAFKEVAVRSLPWLLVRGGAQQDQGLGFRLQGILPRTV